MAVCDSVPLQRPVPAQLAGRTLENRLVDTQVASGTRAEPVNLRARTGDPLEPLLTKTVQNAAQKPAACLAKPCVKLQWAIQDSNYAPIPRGIREFQKKRRRIRRIARTKP